MATSEIDLRERLHQLVDDLTETELSRAEAALSELRQTRERNLRSTRQATLKYALGIAATDRPPPTDEEVDRWLEEERMRKYGL